MGRRRDYDGVLGHHSYTGDKPLEYILVPKCPLFRDSTVYCHLCLVLNTVKLSLIPYSLGALVIGQQQQSLSSQPLHKDHFHFHILHLVPMKGVHTMYEEILRL